jgi:hypothetical protein
VIYAHANESDRALDLLTELIAMPNGPTRGTLRAEREWDALRDNPRFEKLLAR